ncbi:hypothetical protein LOK49_LG01G00392 [Camellia lanceoleosa]|uniref:Uncharacterized protein n=1 Tax=Camellia lanceoleosa TaxID=1840588 RepID=A0ACC0J340_9ERIC|nr:hypothetical protein LOK49_LG01G00392 [Camellia lanceoleosa]
MEVVESSSSFSLSALDRIHQLPGQPQVSYQQFSGYVTVDAKKQKALVFEAESNPASKPLVIWLNEGGMDLIAIIRASGRISHARGLNVPSSGIVGEQFIEKIRRATKRHLSSKIDRVDRTLDESAELTATTREEVSELRGEIQAICVDVQPVHHVVRTVLVIASMADVEASGGYYMAMAAGVIVAEDLTLTGSIDVVTGRSYFIWVSV